MRELTVPGVADQAFEAAIGELRPGLVRRLTVVLGNPEEAEDVAQDACLRAFSRRHAFDGRDLRAWLHVIGVRLALNELRRRRRAVAALVRPPAEQYLPEERGELWEILRQLRPRERAALLLSVLDGYSYAEIGQMLGVPDGTVGSWISRAKAKARVAPEERR